MYDVKIFSPQDIRLTDHTLEPCSFYGRTPSCAHALIQIKDRIDQVSIGIIDPDPRNNGSGIRLLKNAYIEVRVGLLKELILQDLGPFLTQRL